MFRPLCAILACLLLPGCVIIKVGVTNPIPGLSTVAVAPFFNLSQERSVDGRRFALKYYSELQKVPGFQVVPLGVTEQVITDNELQMNDPDDVLELARLLDVDAVVVGAVTDYDPYYPPQIGLQVSWYSTSRWEFEPGLPVNPNHRSDWETTYKKLDKEIKEEERQKREAERQKREAEREVERKKREAERQKREAERAEERRIQEIETEKRRRERDSQQHPEQQRLENRRPIENQENLYIHSPLIRGQSPNPPPLPENIPGNEAPMQPEPQMRPIPPVDDSFDFFPDDSLGPPQQIQMKKPLTAATEAKPARVSETSPPEPKRVPLPKPEESPVVEVEPPKPPAPVPFDPRKPLMSYTRLFDGADADLVATLRDYLELRGDERSGGWEGYLQRSDDFIQFTAHLMIVEMLTLHGGDARRRIVFKLRKHK